MKIKIYDYYNALGIRELCHDVKQSYDWHRQRAAIEKMAAFFIEQGIVNDKSVIVPAPQHTGNAEYTKEIAEIVCRETGAYLFNVLYCDPRETLYDQKKKGVVMYDPGLKIWDVLTTGDIMSLDFDNKSQDFFFLDNVMGTGKTYLTALKLFDEEYGCFNQLIPLVYAIDKKRIDSSLREILHLPKGDDLCEKTHEIDFDSCGNYSRLGYRNNSSFRKQKETGGR